MSLQADPEDMPPNDMDTGSGAERRLTSCLSVASRNYDVGNKGFLDEDERAIRKYDTNNDGNLDVNEIKQIVLDLKDNNKEKRMLKKLAMGATGCLALVLLTNFGLVWATLVLTRQVESQDGALVDTSTGKKLSTQARGNNIVIVPRPEFIDQFSSILEIDGRRLREGTGEEVDVRRLMEGAIGTLEGNAAWAAIEFQDHINGINEHFSVKVDDAIFTGRVSSGVFHTTSADGCEQYGNIQEVGVEGVTYKVRCCRSSDCTLHFQNEASTRRILVGVAQANLINVGAVVTGVAVVVSRALSSCTARHVALASAMTSLAEGGSP